MIEIRQTVRLTRKSFISWALLTAIICSIAIGLLLLIKIIPLLDKVEIDTSALGIFFSVFGVLYAIVAGFITVEAWRRLSDIFAAIQDEVRTIEDAWEAIDFIDDTKYHRGPKREMKELLLKYIDSVVLNEWEEMRTARKWRYERGMSPFLKDIMKKVPKIRTDKDRNYIAVEALIGKLADLSTHRSKRRASAQVFHQPLHILIKFMSLVIVGSFLFWDLNPLWVHIVLLCAIVSSLLTLHVVINDLDNPYTGYWAIDRGLFVSVKKALKDGINTAS